MQKSRLDMTMFFLRMKFHRLPKDKVAGMVLPNREAIVFLSSEILVAARACSALQASRALAESASLLM